MNIIHCTKEEVFAIAVDEAISRLGLVNEKARPALINMLHDDQGQHPRSLCTAYRKAGAQISKEELKAIGLRANAYMSREALAEITDAGREKPLEAHVDTLLRAYFTYARWRTFQSAEVAVKQGAVKREALLFKYDMLQPVCECCAKLNGEPTTPETAHIVPPETCKCVTANYSIPMRIDWFYDLE